MDFHAFEAERWRSQDRTYAAALRRTLAEMQAEAASGRDPYDSRRGMVHRAMRSPLAPGNLRPYGMYVPRSYDPARKWPLLVLLHGGGSDYMATLRLAMGYTRLPGKAQGLAARRIPVAAGLPDLPALIATPSGYGNTDFRWAAETEVLEVVDDVRRHYAVDEDRVWLAGISRGGWAALQIGLRHAGRFAAVVDISGFVDPFVTRPRTAGRWDPPLREIERAMLRLSRPIETMERALGTEVVLIHGGRDPGVGIDGPRAFARRLAEKGLRHQAIVYPHGFHHMWLPALHGGRLFEVLRDARREARPARVKIVAGGYRDAEARWVRIDEFARFGQPARLDARIVARVDGSLVEVQTQNVARFSLALPDAPVQGRVRVVVDGRCAFEGAAASIHLDRRARGWGRSDAAEPEHGSRKVRGVSGPLHDAFFERTVHVYGTGESRARDVLRTAARRGARLGYLGNSTWIVNPIVADRDFRPEDFRGAHVALYGDAGQNSVVRQIAASLPIGVGDGFVELRGRRYGAGHGVRMIRPSPFEPGRYLTVVAAADPRDVPRAMGLPDLSADYVVWDRTTIRGDYAYVLRPSAGFVEAGFFDDAWQLRPESELRRTPGRPGLEALP